MNSLTQELSGVLGEAFAACGLDAGYGKVAPSDRPDLCQFQCNGAMAAAKQARKNPALVAAAVVEAIKDPAIFEAITVAGPGFINLTLTDAFLARFVQRMADDERFGCRVVAEPQTVMVDYGGANIAKPLHVGHLRSAIIGESLKRLARFVGHRVIGDIHMGDWGLQMGMIISEMARRQPELPYFDPQFTGPYPEDPPFTISDLEEIYPAVSQLAKTDEQVLEAARQATFELQNGRPGYRALWQHIFNVSVADLQGDYQRLNIQFDLWLGESDAQPLIPAMVERLRAEGLAKLSEGALVIEVAEADDKKELPPLILTKSDGAYLYGTTDLATIAQRVRDYQPELILYVVDKRQADHFVQVFRSAYKTGIAPETLRMEHIGFGTMNGPDGRPFKTRAGGVMKLKDLIAMITEKALEKVQNSELASELDPEQMLELAQTIGVATLKFADLMNHRLKDYLFDLERFSVFEGCTGPYHLYVAVRINSILKKAAAKGLSAGPMLAPAGPEERDILLKLVEFPDVIFAAFEQRSPNYLCDYLYQLASAFTRFYHQYRILTEPDPARQASWLQLSQTVLAVLRQTLDILGMEVPERM